MSKLIPTVITDVNGKTTTVYRKSTEARKASPVPAPAVNGTLSPSKQGHTVVEELVNALGLRIQYVSQRVRDNIIALTDDDVEILRDALSSAPPRSMKKEEFQSAMLHRLNSDDGDAGRHIRNTLVLLESELPVYYHYSFLQTLRKRGEFKEAAYDLYGADNDSKKLICGIANAIYTLRNLESSVQDENGDAKREPLVNTLGGQLELRDPALLSAILSNPEHAEAIASLYVERGSLDSLSEVFNASAAIREGAL